MTVAIGASWFRANLMSAAVRMPTTVSLCVEDGKSAERVPFVLPHFADGLQRVRDAEGDRVRDQSVEVVLDRAHDLRLLLGGEVAVDDADAAQHGHGDGHARLGHRVHRGADERDVDGDAR